MQTLKMAMGSAAILIMMSAGAAAQGLPGGASSINESHGDWTVACAMRAESIRCVMSQTQIRGENRQRVLAIELTAVENGQAASGTLVLPFGLKLDEGVNFAIDDAAPFESSRFSTCLPAGCLVPLVFNPEAVTAMRAGTALKVKAAANDSGQEVTFSVSLSGFSSALARAAELTTR